MSKNILWAFSAALVILAVGGLSLLEIQEIQAGPTISVTLTASPYSFSGYCPAKIALNGVMVTDAACTVQYKYNESGAIGPIKIYTLNCPGPGNHPFTRTLNTSQSGWAEVEVLSPAKVRSNRAIYYVTCLPKPNITKAYFVNIMTGEIVIIGTNFGQTQGSRNLIIDNTPVTSMPGASIATWSNQGMEIYAPSLVPWTHTYQMAITDGGTVISNVFPARMIFVVQLMSPSPNVNVHPGTSVHIRVPKLPSSPGSLRLVFRSHAGTEYTLPYVNWIAPDIYTAVPNVPDGDYDYVLMDGALEASNPGDAHIGVKN